MYVEKITDKTIRIEAEPGDRINVDSEGYGCQTLILKWNGNEGMKRRLSDVLKMRKRKNISEDEKITLNEERNSILDWIIKTLPVYKSKKVFVGFNF